MLRVLDLLRTLGLPWIPQSGREALIGGLARVSDDVAAALDGYRWFTLTEAYGRPGPDGHNPNWDQLGYPGPPDVLPPQRERLSTFDIAPGTGRAGLDADVVSSAPDPVGASWRLSSPPAVSTSSSSRRARITTR